MGQEPQLDWLAQESVYRILSGGSPFSLLLGLLVKCQASKKRRVRNLCVGPYLEGEIKLMVHFDTLFLTRDITFFLENHMLITVYQ